ncbi:ribosomal protein S18 acetylase RimI-like enzyme [Actinoplanes campanulatus]|uniref:Ribosomal protein S18 acetylase RimI-like enzyme n=1 Tax=Actinoplanes campanulatus TaxID=113559 RepID=A0A7W5FEH7_9ACTN|nr:GNAT family N-acetyltransferase [Actinoplanes campanulatus]MBB3095543.1 ribosomal protein S18 acetylase RimI-like enzyme [Actinoplanes campanulatus]GGN09743.1 N-acetyltransferase [Actinoplanes campanulatus]GID36435.1 N-acetyltransferase [Actinoplanes campanulatus]
MRLARVEEAGALSELALRSKAYWGYDEPFLEACRAELTLLPGEVTSRRTSVVEIDGRIAGFYTLDGQPPEGELGNLWIDPEHLRRGIGRGLWQHAMGVARELGFTTILIDAEPHAEGFYLEMGATTVGTTPSTSIPGRVLPRMRFDLK